MYYPSSPPLDDLHYFLYRIDDDPELGREFYAATTPEEMVVLAEHCGVLIDADDICSVLRSGITGFWFFGGKEGPNPMVHLQQIFGV